MFNSFSEIQEALKMFSFESKMNLSQIESGKTMDDTGSFSYDPNNLSKIAFPWEIETFVILSCMSVETDNKPLVRQKFIDSINHIRNYIDNNLITHKGTDTFAEWFIITCSQVQFECQKNHMFLFYRYQYYFTYKDSNIDMDSLFRTKFDFAHHEFLLLSQLMWFAFSIKMDCSEYLSEIYSKYREHIIKHLSISREEYNKLFIETGKSIENCVYSIRPSYSYPFIQFGENHYLPTPHLLFQAVTTSMLYRLTENNDSLRKTIGKTVFESYLEMISQNSCLYDEIYSEHVYYVPGSKVENRTLDLLTRIGDSFILFDSKSFTPKSALRLFSEKAYNDDIERLAKAVAQVYIHLTTKFRTLYYPFTYEKSRISDDKVFGIVIVQDEPHFFMDSIYDKAITIIENKLDNQSVEVEYLKKHVGLLSIYDYERIVFCKNDIVSLLEKRKNDAYHNFDLNFTDIIKDENFLRYRDVFLQETLKIAGSFLSKRGNIPTS